MTAANGLPLGAEINSKFTQQILTGTASELVNKGAIAEMFAGWELVKSANPKMQPEQRDQHRNPFLLGEFWRNHSTREKNCESTTLCHSRL